MTVIGATNQSVQTACASSDQPIKMLGSTRPLHTLGSAQIHMDTLTLMHTHMHTLIHARAHTYTHAHKLSHAHAHTPVTTPPQTDRQTDRQTHTQTDTHADTHRDTLTHPHTHTHSSTHTGSDIALDTACYLMTACDFLGSIFLILMYLYFRKLLYDLKSKSVDAHTSACVMVVV